VQADTGCSPSPPNAQKNSLASLNSFLLFHNKKLMRRQMRAITKPFPQVLQAKQKNLQGALANFPFSQVLRAPLCTKKQFRFAQLFTIKKKPQTG